MISEKKEKEEEKHALNSNNDQILEALTRSIKKGRNKLHLILLHTREWLLVQNENSQ